MKMSTRITVRFVVVLAIVLGTFVARSIPATAQQGGLDPAPDPRVAGIEQDFLMGMIPHHRGAIMMAEMAVTKASRPEVRELAQKIITDQQPEVQLMTNWLQNWYGMQPPQGTMMPADIMMRMDMPMLRGLMPDMEARMEALKAKSGPAFDIEFLSAMSDHHAQAVMMSTPVLIAGHHRDLYPFTTHLVASQSEEIGQMRDYLERFYGIVRPLSTRPR
ncbi:MAG: DUF305 domain-containing protein [Chloroflexi bacterium]|nr:MAG: DUF305 domain-containing protein [Chloroflexota bacterium]